MASLPRFAQAFRKLALSATALIGLALSPAFAEDINALVWCDHSDPNFLKPFEDSTGIKVNVKEFEGTGAGLAILDQSQPGEWDVMVIDSVDVRRGVDKKLFEPLPEDKLPFGELPGAFAPSQAAVVLNCREEEPGVVPKKSLD